MSIDNPEKAEILEFLEEIKPAESKSPAVEGVEVKSFLTEDEFQLLQESEEARKREKIEGVPEIPANKDFELRPHDDLFSAMVADLGKVEVSDYEKDLFIKALLNDTTFTTISKVMGGRISIKIKSRNLYNDNLVFKALTKDEGDRVFVGIEGMLQRMQAYIAAVQISEINGKDYNLDISNEDSFDVNYEKLNQHLKKYDSMQTHMWAAIVLAVRIHEYKTKICMDNLNNENFWESSGINT